MTDLPDAPAPYTIGHGTFGGDPVVTIQHYTNGRPIKLSPGEAEDFAARLREERRRAEQSAAADREGDRCEDCGRLREGCDTIVPLLSGEGFICGACNLESPEWPTEGGR